MFARIRSIAMRRRVESIAEKRARLMRLLTRSRARKRSYSSQLDALDTHTSPADTAVIYARGQLLELIAREVSLELDLLDELDVLEGGAVMDDFGPELHTENELEAAGAF